MSDEELLAWAESQSAKDLSNYPGAARYVLEQSAMWTNPDDISTGLNEVFGLTYESSLVAQYTKRHLDVVAVLRDRWHRQRPKNAITSLHFIAAQLDKQMRRTDRMLELLDQRLGSEEMSPKDAMLILKIIAEQRKIMQLGMAVGGHAQPLVSLDMRGIGAALPNVALTSMQKRIKETMDASGRAIEVHPKVKDANPVAHEGPGEQDTGPKLP